MFDAPVESRSRFLQAAVRAQLEPVGNRKLFFQPGGIEFVGKLGQHAFGDEWRPAGLARRQFEFHRNRQIIAVACSIFEIIGAFGASNRAYLLAPGAIRASRIVHRHAPDGALVRHFDQPRRANFGARAAPDALGAINARASAKALRRFHRLERIWQGYAAGLQANHHFF